jgi:hypothetical protein
MHIVIDKKIRFLLVLLSFPITLFGIEFLELIGYKCPWKTLFNIDCAGCGVTRMIKALFRLEFYQAFRYNSLFFILIVLFIIYLIYILVCKIRKINFYKLSYRELYILSALLIVFMILRNIPGLEFLKPTDI